MSSRSKSERVEVWLVEPGQERPRFSFQPAQLKYLPADAPLPAVGDIVVLPRTVTGDAKAQAFAWGRTLAPFRVVEREHVYFRAKDEKHDPADPKPVHFVKTLPYVRRLTEEEYGATPGRPAG
ncbi:MAG TPA: hypothetical protein VFD50_01315 [Thermoleophilia bacterium]|nr:hypothetical protein [Thermoleophilia bacterium]